MVVDIPSVLLAIPNVSLSHCPSLQRLKDEIAEVTSEIENLGSTEER